MLPAGTAQPLGKPSGAYFGAVPPLPVVVVVVAGGCCHAARRGGPDVPSVARHDGRGVRSVDLDDGPSRQFAPRRLSPLATLRVMRGSERLLP